MKKPTLKKHILIASSILWNTKSLLLLSWLQWGTFFLIYLPPFGEFIPFLRLLEPAFYGKAHEVTAPRAEKKKTSIFRHILSNIIGIFVITAFLISPLFVLFVLMGIIFGLEQAPAIMNYLAFGIPLVPTIVSIWDFILRKSTILDAIAGGLLRLRGYYMLSAALGLFNYALIFGLNQLREYLIPAGAIVIAILLDTLFAVFQGVFRIYMLVWLYPDYVSIQSKKKAFNLSRFRP